MMRILHVISSCASGGAEVFVRDLAIETQRSGHQVAVAYVSAARDQGSSLAFEQTFQEKLNTEGVRLFELGHRTRKNPLLGALAIHGCLREFQPDVVHFHIARALLFRCLVPARTPTVYTHHNTVLSFHPLLFRGFDRCVDRYVAICAASETLLREHVRRPVVRIYNGIDPARIAPPAARSEGERFQILSVGNLTPQKNYDDLIEVAATLVRRSPEDAKALRFSVAGEGGERARLERLVHARGLDGVVTFLGTRTDVSDLMRAADLLLMTSVFEGFPVSLLEASAAGLPVVCTDVGGCGEIVDDGETGFVVPSGRTDGLADAVQRLLSDASLRARQSASARARFRFTVEAACCAHLQMYRSILAGAGEVGMDVNDAGDVS